MRRVLELINRRGFLVTAAILLVGSSLLGPIVANAANSLQTAPLSLTITPLVIDLNTTPGKPVTTQLRVKQDGGDTETLVVSLKKFTAEGESGKALLQDRAPGDDYFDWVHFDRTSIAAPSGVWQTVNMTVNVPKTAAFGYYYAVTFQRAGTVAHPGQTDVINGGTAILVLLDVNAPGANKTLKIVSFKTDHTVYEFLPVNFAVQLQDVGNLDAIPSGTIFIQHGSKQVASIDLNATQGHILPKSYRIYNDSWTAGFPHFANRLVNGKMVLNKKGQPEQQLVWDWSKLTSFRMGEYTAHLLAVYDNGTRDVPIEAYVNFWVIPWRFILVLLVVIALVLGGVYAAARGAWRGARRLRRR